MTGKNHIALALTIPLALEMTGAVSILPTSAIAWSALILGSLAPDIDGEGAIARWGNFLPQHITPQPVIKLLNWAGRTVSSLVRTIFGHRNALHWPLWGLLMIAISTKCGPIPFTPCNLIPATNLLFWFGLGYILHIFGDSLTVSGVPIFGPIWNRDISFFPMVTGSRFEGFVGLLLWCFVGWRVVTFTPLPQWLGGVL